jgi:hypothetical protein
VAGARRRSSTKSGSTGPIGSVERAERNVSIDNIARIAKALAVEPWKLLKDG